MAAITLVESRHATAPRVAADGHDRRPKATKLTGMQKTHTHTHSNAGADLSLTVAPLSASIDLRHLQLKKRLLPPQSP